MRFLNREVQCLQVWREVKGTLTVLPRFLSPTRPWELLFCFDRDRPERGRERGREREREREREVIR